MANIWDRLKAAVSIGNANSFSNPNAISAKEQQKRVNAQQLENAIKNARYGVLANNPQRQQQFTQSIQPTRFNTIQATGQSIRQAPIRTARAFQYGVPRSLTGAAEGFSGLYDLATPGKGTNRLTKKLVKAGADIDKRAMDARVDPATYRAAQATTEALQFVAPSAVASGVNKVAKGTSKASKAAQILAKTTPYVNKPGLKYISTPANLLNTAVGTAKQQGFNAARERDISAKTLARDLAINLAMGKAIQSVPNVIAKAASKRISKPVINKPKLTPLNQEGAVRLPFTKGEPGADLLRIKNPMGARTGLPIKNTLDAKTSGIKVKSSVPLEKKLKIVDKNNQSTYKAPLNLKIKNNSGNKLVGEGLSGAAQQSWLSKLKNSNLVKNEGGYVKVPNRREPITPETVRMMKDYIEGLPKRPGDGTTGLTEQMASLKGKSAAEKQSLMAKAKAKLGIKDLNEGGYLKLPFNKANQESKLDPTKLQGKQSKLKTQPNLSQATDMADDLTNNIGKKSVLDRSVSPNPEMVVNKNSTYTNTKPQRAFKSNLAKDTEVSARVYKDIPGYTVKPNTKTISDAAKRVSVDPEGTYNRLLINGAKTTEDNADSLVLLRKLVENDELDKAQKLANATAKSATSAGQAVQIFSAFRKTTPDGALRDVYSRINAFNKANPNKKPIDLSPEQAKNITKLADELQTLKPNSREWAVKAAQLEREKGLAIPSSFLSKLSQVQTMSQLLNPKTFIRNVIGNTVLDIGEDVSRLSASGIDKALYKMGLIDKRNVVTPNLKTNWLNKLTGFKQGAEDVKLGIRTQGMAGNYDLSKELFKPGSVGNKLEKVLGYELGTFDKAFYTGRYQSSLDNMMKAQKLTEPTAEMKTIADAEALYATFQNNSAIAKALTSTKKGLNAGKDWGVGDLILKYPKTPGNIVSVGLDYSPVGFVKGLKGLYDGIKQADMSSLRTGEINIGRSITGSGLILGGAYLAKQGIITGRKEQDKDQNAANQQMGMSPFSFNITALGRLLRGEDTQTKPGDITANYDWLQPNAIQLTMGANMVINKNDSDQQINDALQSLGSGLDTVSEQPVFQGVTRFAQNLNTQTGGGIGKAIGGLLTDLPASFTPGIVNQVGQLTDNTKRSTYSPNSTEEATNKVKSRLPIARQTLEPAINTLGEEQKQYDVGGNNPLNVFFNPSFVRRVKDEPAINLSNDLNKTTGETSQYPRVAQKSIKINGQDKALTSNEYTDYQRYIGQNTNKVYTTIQNNERFKNLPDDKKVEILQRLQTEINSAAKIRLFGDQPKTVSESVQSFIDDNIQRPIELKLESADKANKPKAPKTTKVKTSSRKVRSSRGGARASRKSGVKLGSLPRIRLSKAPNVKIGRTKKAKFATVRKGSQKRIKIA